VGTEGKLGGQAEVRGVSGTWKDLTDNVNRLAANLTTQVRAIAGVATAVTQGDLTRSIQVDARGEVEMLKDTINQMIANLRATTQKNADQDWLKTNIARFTRTLQGQRDLQTVARNILTELSRLVAAHYGAFYIVEGRDEGIRLKLLSSLAAPELDGQKMEFRLGEGLVGECAAQREVVHIKRVPEEYLRIRSGLGEARPADILVLPAVFEGQLKAVLELASFENFGVNQLAFLEQLMEVIGIVLHTLEANLRTETLLKSLQAQQEELRQTNQELEEKADQLALTSKFKSEFLSNMSHELRTPLNSMLILSQQLVEDSRNLTPREVEFAKTIHASGGDLLVLINDILDLSKVESGTMTLEVEDVGFNAMTEHMDRVFRHIAEAKQIGFGMEFDPTLPEAIRTDEKRLEQILRNLLSNAFKFTEKGQVTLRVDRVSSGWSADHPVLTKAGEVLAFSVRDTGIGIPADKQKIIFEAFQQAESGTSRKYGGTGLGLSISRELAKLLGGQLSLSSSVPEKGSTFVLYLPVTYMAAKMRSGEAETVNLAAAPSPRAFRPRPATFMDQAPAPVQVADDRGAIVEGDQVLLVVEDDPTFAKILLDLARERGFKGLVALRGDDATSLVSRYKPSAITLDIRMPDMDGWSLLARFKNDPATRHIPVYILSADADRIRALKQGAFSIMNKPVSKNELDKVLGELKQFIEGHASRLLLVEKDEGRRRALLEQVGSDGVETKAVADAEEALQELKRERYDCLVIELPGPSGLQALEAIRHEAPELPVILHTGQELSKDEAVQLKAAALKGVVKEVSSPERLLDETTLYLHSRTDQLSDEKRRMVEQLHLGDSVFHGKKILVVDDDIRNIFAMTSLLERHQMEVFSAESGREALDLLKRKPEVDAVLMDIMMPEMDGYDTMRAIRQKEDFKTLPIIAVTAKAMRGDREKCIEMGASDYITKPVDSEQLLSLLRVWLYR
jgi:CheY-like chemotaxis protein/signal transduction histidine kinase/HAMP domain-containing protein